jgi:hypothetical protein
MRKERGSAILIAVLLVAAIGGIAFSFGRIFLLEAANANTAENGVSAFYAAESGIEEGMLRYRYNRSAEVPFSSWGIGEKSVFRANITDGAVSTNSFSGVDKATTAISSSGKQYYDLRMGFIGTNDLPIYGHDEGGAAVFDKSDLLASTYGTGDYQFLRIPKDETYKIDLSNIDFSVTTNDLRIFAKYRGTTNKSRSLMYLKLTVDYLGNGSDVKEYKTIVSSDTATATCTVLGRTDPGCASDIIIATNESSSPDVVWRRDNLLSAIKTQTGARTPLYGTSKVTLSIKPIFFDAYIGLSTVNCTTYSLCTNSGKKDVIPGPFSTIVSTGYFGGTTRTIEANIDRQSGTLYDLYDYVIFEKQ